MNAPQGWDSGSIIKVWLPDRNVYHYGILQRTWFWPDQAIHNSKDRGSVVRTSLDEFAQGNPVELERASKSWEVSAILSRAESQIGKKSFSLREWNCEDFVTWVFEGVPRSPQRDSVVAAGLVGVLAALVIVLIAKAESA